MSFQSNGVFLEAQGESGAECVYEAKELLKSAGWVVTESGDGSSTYSTSDLLTSAAAIVDDSWFTIQDPAGLREFQVQATLLIGHEFRVKYSRAAGFVGGTPSATQVSSATDEAVCKGGGTDAAPTGEAWWHAGAGTDPDDRVVGGAETVAPYRFWFASRQDAFPYASGFGWAMEGIDLPEDVTEDTDPVVLYFLTQGSPVAYQTAALASYASGAGKVVGWLDIGGTPTFVRFAAQTYLESAQINPNVHNSKWEIVPILYARSAGQTDPDGVKGWGTGCLLWILNSVSSPFNVVLNVGGSSANWMRLDTNIAVPWDGSTPTLPAAYGNQDTQLSLPSSISSGGLVGDGKGPEITNLTPGSGSVLPSRFTPVFFNIGDADGIKDIIITCQYEGSPDALLVYDDQGFSGQFAGRSVFTANTGDLGDPSSFSILPSGGWPRNITALKVNGFDIFGSKTGVDV